MARVAGQSGLPTASKSDEYLHRSVTTQHYMRTSL
jgi:hypothetical protein